MKKSGKDSKDEGDRLRVIELRTRQLRRGGCSTGLAPAARTVLGSTMDGTRFWTWK